MARQVDAAVVVLGENTELFGESKSRTSLELTGFQLRLVQAVHEAGKPTVVVLLNGRPLTINWIDRNIPGIIEAWFQGEYCGTAIADVLFGDYNVSEDRWPNFFEFPVQARLSSSYAKPEQGRKESTGKWSAISIWI
jgi:hypothetical protein